MLFQATILRQHISERINDIPWRHWQFLRIRIQKDWFWNSFQIISNPKRLHMKEHIWKHRMFTICCCCFFFMTREILLSLRIEFVSKQKFVVVVVFILPPFDGVSNRNEIERVFRGIGYIKIQLSQWRWHNGGRCATWNHFMCFFLYGWEANLKFSRSMSAKNVFAWLRNRLGGTTNKSVKRMMIKHWILRTE